MFFNKGLRFTVAEIEVNSSEKRFESIGDDVGIGISSCEKLSFGDEYVILKMERESDGGEIFSANERTTNVGEFSLGFSGIRMKEEFRDYELQNGISEEFEPLVALRHMDDIFIQNGSVNERETIIGDIFIGNLERRYE